MRKYVHSLAWQALATEVTKPYKFIGFGAREVTKLYKFVGFGAMDVTADRSFFGLL